MKKTLALIVIALLLCQPAFARLYAPRGAAAAGGAKAAPKATAAAKGIGLETAVDKKYDMNKNGVLEANEVKMVLRERYETIKNERMPKVGSAAERQYDANRNGVLEPNEIASIATAMR